MAADLAVFYSNKRGDRKALVTYTSPKHVTKPAGAPLGAVRLRQEDGTIVGNPDGVPAEARAAREDFPM